MQENSIKENTYYFLNFTEEVFTDAIKYNQNLNKQSDYDKFFSGDRSMQKYLIIN